MKESQSKFYSVLAISVLFAGALFIFVEMVMPDVDEIKILRGQRDSSIIAYNNTLSNVDHIKKLKAAYDSLSGARASLNSFIPSSDDTSDLVNQLNGLAKLNNLSVASINFKNEVPELPPGETAAPIPAPNGTVAATMRLSGYYENIKTFIAMIETNIRLIDTVSISISGGGSTSPILDCTLVAKAYYQP